MLYVRSVFADVASPGKSQSKFGLGGPSGFHPPGQEHEEVDVAAKRFFCW